jgi:hypothetical protein
MNKKPFRARDLYLRAAIGKDAEDITTSTYYNLPSDIVGLLLDYLPLNIQPSCYLVPCMSKNLRVLDLTPFMDQLIDSIVKHDFEFFTTSWVKLRSLRYDQPLCEIRRQNDSFLSILYTCWKIAFKYGRLKFLDVLLQVDREGWEADCGCGEPHPTYAAWWIDDENLVEHAGTIETVNWILDNCILGQSDIRYFIILCRSIGKERILMLELVYMYYARQNLDPAEQVFACVSTEAVTRLITKIQSRPRILEWFRSHKWSEEVKAKLFAK